MRVATSLKVASNDSRPDVERVLLVRPKYPQDFCGPRSVAYPQVRAVHRPNLSSLW